MNPDTGQLHAQLRRLVGQRLGADVAERRKEVEDYLQGPQLPPDWPRFKQGQIVGPLAGWHWMVTGVDLEEQVLVLKPFKAIQKAAGPKPKKRRTKKKRTKRRRR